MTFDELNVAVSRAIRAAEESPSPAAWARVARLEQDIVAVTAASTVSGEAARMGAVLALEESDTCAAADLARRYAAEPGLAPRMREALEDIAVRLEAL